MVQRLGSSLVAHNGGTLKEFLDNLPDAPSGSTLEANPMDYGGVGDGIADDTAAVRAALDSSLNVVIPTGKTFKITSAYIQLRGQTISGGGTIDGTIVVAMPKGDNIWTSIIAEVAIRGITFKGGLISSIILRRGRGIRIHDCNFRDVSNCVAIQPLEQDYDGGSHCVEDVNITNNTCSMVDRLLYVDTSLVIHSGRNWWMGCGDINVNNNICRVSRVSFISGDRIDGLLCSGNSMLNWGSSSQDNKKEYGIHISHQGAQILIQGNNIFETGLEGIRLNNCASTIIQGNNLVQCGQRAVRSAIYLQGAVGSSEFVTISNNIINQISGHPIALGNVSKGSVQGNTAYIGNRGFYYGGESLSPITDLHMVVLEGACDNVRVDNNSASELINRGVSKLAVGLASKAILRYDLNFNGGAIDGTAERVHLAQPSANTVSRIEGGYDGMVITLVAYNGNTTLADAGHVSGSNLLGVPGGQMVVPANKVVQFIRSGTVWFYI